VDSNMAASYKAAKAAGITNVDAYIFPCTPSPSSPAPHISPNDVLIAP